MKRNYNFVKCFANLDGLRRYLETAPKTNLFAYTEHSRTGSRAFTGTDSYEEADNLLRDGDTERAKRLTACIATGLKTGNDGTRARRYNHVCGGTVNVPAVLMGLPKSMINLQKIQYKNSKVLSFVYSNAIDCSVGESEISEVSARLVCAVLGLEKKGYRVNLYSCICIEDGHERTGLFLRIKDSGQYMDTKKLAYPLINPSMLRRHAFRFIETAPGLTRSGWTAYYGHPVRDAYTITELAKEAGLTAKKVVTFYDIRRMSAPQIMEYLLKN